MDMQMTTNTDALDALPDRWISLNELARRLGVHPGTLFRWRRAGVRGVRLRTTRLGGRTGVQAPDLSEFFGELNAAPARCSGAVARHQPVVTEIPRA